MATAKKVSFAKPAARSTPAPSTAAAGASTVPAAKASDRVAAAKAVQVKKKAVPQAAAKAAAKPGVEKPLKAKKPKLVRDSFTIPKPEYAVLDDLKQRAARLASPAKKSELLRSGIKALAAMPDEGFLAALKAVPAIKTGRPTKV